MAESRHDDCGMSPTASAPDDDTKSSMHMTMHDLMAPPKNFISPLLRITKTNLSADRHHRMNERLRMQTMRRDYKGLPLPVVSRLPDYSKLCMTLCYAHLSSRRTRALIPNTQAAESTTQQYRDRQSSADGQIRASDRWQAENAPYSAGATRMPHIGASVTVAIHVSRRRCAGRLARGIRLPDDVGPLP